MIRVIVALLVLGLGAIGWVLLLPGTGPKTRATGSPAPQIADAATVQVATPAKTAPVVPPSETGREIRVVYPGPDGTASVRKLADKVMAEASPVPAAQASVAPAPPPAPPAPATVPAPPPGQQTASVVPAPAAPPPGSGQAVNINTASVEALNQLPGVGHIGRTIASHRPYGSIEELVSKRVLRKSVYDRIKDQIAAN